MGTPVYPEKATGTGQNKDTTINANVVQAVLKADGVRLGQTGGKVGFYGTTPVVLQTGVAVSAAGVHAALVNLGLITA